MRISQIWQGIERRFSPFHTRRCYGCGIVIDEGEQTVYLLLPQRVVYASHIGCTDVPTPVPIANDSRRGRRTLPI
jgi:hypothetical protein